MIDSWHVLKCVYTHTPLPFWFLEKREDVDGGSAIIIKRGEEKKDEGAQRV